MEPGAGPQLHAALFRECDTVIAQFAHVPALRDAIQQRDDLQTQLGAAAKRQNYTMVTVLGMKLTALQETIARMPLSEEIYRTLPMRQATLEQKVALQCEDLTTAHNWAAIEPLAAKLEQLRAVVISGEFPSVCRGCDTDTGPVPDVSSSCSDHIYQPAGPHLTFASNGVPITKVEALYSVQPGLLAASVRLMLRGEFRSVDSGTGIAREYRCLIKCASYAADIEPSATDVNRLRREHAMYQEVQRLAPAVGTGCVRCYSIDLSGLYMVLEDYDTDLRALLTSELKSPQIVMEGIAPAVHALHGMNIMHGDIKPENLLVQHTLHGHYVVKLCDLECATKVGEMCEAATLGTKHYLAPEVRVAASLQGKLRASTAVDMFALGLVLWQVMKRSPTAALDCDSEARLDELYSDQAQLNAHLEHPALYRVFMERFTCLEPARRPGVTELCRNITALSVSNAHQCLIRERQENTFLKHSVHDNLMAIQHDLGWLRRDQEALGRHISTVLADNAALNHMAQTLISGTHTTPTLAIVLPEVSKSWVGSLKSPMRLLRNHFRLYFLCSHTKQIPPCGPGGKGYKIAVTKKWVQDAAPVLRVGLVLVKVALLASGLPLPVPDLCSALADATKHCKYLDAALHLVTHPPDDDLKSAEHVMKSALETVKAYDVNNLLAEHGVTTQTNQLQLQEGSRKAYETIREVLVAQGHNIALTCGLRQVTCSRTGRTAWVLDNDATERAWRDDVSA
jgi:serine/threonine protein kinase